MVAKVPTETICIMEEVLEVVLELADVFGVFKVTHPVCTLWMSFGRKRSSCAFGTLGDLLK